MTVTEVTGRPLDESELSTPIAAGVREALDRLSAPVRLSDAAWAVQSAVFADRQVNEDDAAAWVETELRIVEAVETVKAWADFQGLGALERIREAVYEQVRARNDQMEHAARRTVMAPGEVAGEAVTATVDEVALATGMPTWEAARRLELASDQDGRGARLLSALACGEVTLDRALRIHRDTEPLGTEVALAISERLLAPGRDGTIRSHAAFLRELRRQVAAHTPDPAEERADAIAARDATAMVDSGKGTGSLLVTGEASRVCADIDRVDALARRLRAAGDPRTLRQLRSDVALDLLLYGWVSPHRSGGDVGAKAAPEVPE